MTEMTEPMPVLIDQEQLARDLVERLRAEGVELVGSGGLLSGLTKTVLETDPEAASTPCRRPSESQHLVSVRCIRVVCSEVICIRFLRIGAPKRSDVIKGAVVGVGNRGR